MADGSLSPIRVERAVRSALVADLFCGAGGMSTGAERAFRELGQRMSLVGVNHWPVAIETNRRNHPEHAARISCANLETALPLDHVPEGRLDLLMAAPSCVFHSRARGGRPVHDQQRMDPWHVVRWCTELRVSRLLVENVPEFVDWGPCSLVTGKPIKSRRGEYFRAWVAALQAVGFRLDWRVLCCADYGDPTTRRRFFLIGRSDRGPLVWPEPTHARVASSDLAGSRSRWRGAREVIDWSIEGASIFTRKRPLKPNTLRRILAGAVKYSWPQPYVEALQALLEEREPRLVFSRAEAASLGLVQSAGVGITLSTASGGAPRALDEPLPTITTGGAGGARPGCARPQLVEPLIVPVSNSSSAGVPRSAGDPIRTVTTAKGGDQALAVPLVAPYYGGGSGLSSVAVSAPLPSVTTKARFGLAEGFLVPNFGERAGQTPRVHGLDVPMPTITASGHVQLAQPALEALDEVRIDVNYRMLHWRELARATSFDDEGHVYDFAGTATEITKQIGNAVPNRTAKALVRALIGGGA
jgi:DNA (cytosine-5)-methyltransferase 1